VHDDPSGSGEQLTPLLSKLVPVDLLLRTSAHSSTSAVHDH